MRGHLLGTHRSPGLPAHRRLQRGDASLSTAELGYYYHVARNRFNSTMSMFGGSGLDNSKSDAEQMYNQEENKSYRDYCLESVK